MAIEIKLAPKLSYDFNKYIFVKENYIENQLCEKLIQECKDKVVEGQAKNWASKFSKFELGIEHYIHQHFMNLWEEVMDFYKIKLDFVEPYHIKRYSFGDNYSSHVDNFSSILDRKLSLVVQLSHSKSYGAGELIIANKNVTKERGSVIVFPSHFTHSVNKIGFGERWVLITWAWAPTF